MFLRHEDESNHVLRLAALIDHADQVKELKGLNACFPDRPHDRYFLIGDAEPWSRELCFELQRRRELARLQLGWGNT